MILADNYTDSLLIYADWLEDNEQLALATEIRQELLEISTNLYYYEFYNSRIGSVSTETGVGSGEEYNISCYVGSGQYIGKIGGEHFDIL